MDRTGHSPNLAGRLKVAQRRHPSVERQRSAHRRDAATVAASRWACAGPESLLASADRLEALTFCAWTRRTRGPPRSCWQRNLESRSAILVGCRG